MATEPKDSWSKFFAALPRRGKIELLSGIFLIFASYPIVYNLASGRDLPWYHVVGWACYSGAVAIGWVLAVSYTMKLLFLVVPISFLMPSIWGQIFWRPGQIISTTTFEFLLFMVCLVGGYVFVVRFIGGEGTRSLRHRTEIALAREVHRALVPPVDLRVKGFEIYGASDPATEVGGDLLDVAREGGKVGVYVADVTGHGVPAGVMMSMIKSAVRMRTRTSARLEDLMTDLNEVLHEVQKPGMFATFAVLRIENAGEVSFCLAGHPPLLHHRSSTGEVTRYEACGPPLGVVPSFAFQSSELRLASGDLVVLLTDGCIEVFNDKGEAFGETRFIDSLRFGADRPLPELHAAMLASARQFGRQDDDQTLLLMRFTHAASFDSPRSAT